MASKKDKRSFLKSSSEQSDYETLQKNIKRERKREREKKNYVNPSTDRGIISDPNYPYFFWVEISRAWADDSNDVSHLSISHV